MDADKQFESLIQLRNTSKPYKLACLKHIGNLIGFLVILGLEIVMNQAHDKYHIAYLKSFLN